MRKLHTLQASSFLSSSRHLEVGKEIAKSHDAQGKRDPADDQELPSACRSEGLHGSDPKCMISWPR